MRPVTVWRQTERQEGNYCQHYCFLSVVEAVSAHKPYTALEKKIHNSNFKCENKHREKISNKTNS